MALDTDARRPYTRLVQEENDLTHHSYDEERSLFSAIQRGDVKAALEHARQMTTERSGKLSEDAFRNSVYLFVSCATLATRYCIEGGLAPELAYMISDIYIRRADKCTLTQQIDELRVSMIEDFANRMFLLRGAAGASAPVLRAAEHIFHNIERRLSVNDVAKHVGLSPSRIAHLFSSQMGMSIGDYIRIQRVEAAKEMLRFSKMTSAQIAAQLSFSSQSHFISVFRRTTGMTPGEYAASAGSVFRG